MHTIATIRQFTTANFSVRVRAVEDFDLDLSWDEDGSVRAKLESGELCSFGVIAEAFHGESKLAEDSLWGCIYANPAEFQDHKGIAHTKYGSYFSDMVRNVCREARKTLQSLQTTHVRA